MENPCAACRAIAKAAHAAAYDATLSALKGRMCLGDRAYEASRDGFAAELNAPRCEPCQRALDELSHPFPGFYGRG